MSEPITTIKNNGKEDAIHSIIDRTKKIITALIFAGIVVFQIGNLWAIPLYDKDGDCDVDGADLNQLITLHCDNLSAVLPTFANELGGIGSDCDTIGIGTPIDGYPNWHERTLLVFTNMVRMAPTEYRDTYMDAYTFPPGGILNNGFPAVAPLTSNHLLNQAARYHAADMAFNCGTLQHDSCDGTLWYERIRSFYPQAGAIGGNVAYTSNNSGATPWRIVNLLLCDAVGDICAADDQPFAVIGHRVNIMSDGFTEMGSGFAMGSGAYWVQDFNGVQLPPQPPIAAGCHALVDAGATTFYLNYYDVEGSAPQEVLLVLDDQAHILALGSGTAGAGTYQVTVPGAADCRAYYFLATDGAGDRYRYPGTGVFSTYGEGVCMLDFTADE